VRQPLSSDRRQELGFFVVREVVDHRLVSGVPRLGTRQLLLHRQLKVATRRKGFLRKARHDLSLPGGRGGLCVLVNLAILLKPTPSTRAIRRTVSPRPGAAGSDIWMVQIHGGGHDEVLRGPFAAQENH